MRYFYEPGERTPADFSGAENLATIFDLDDLKMVHKKIYKEGEIEGYEFESKKLQLSYSVLFYFKTKEIVILSIRFGVPNITIFLALLTGIIKNSEGVFDIIRFVAIGDYARRRLENGYFLAAKFGFSASKESKRLIRACLKRSSLSRRRKQNYRNLGLLLYSEHGQRAWQRIGCEWLGFFDMHEASINMRRLLAELEASEMENFL